MSSKQAWEVWTRIQRPDVEEYHGTVKGLACELWWDDQSGVEPGWCVRINAGVRHREQDIPVKGRRDSKLETIHRNVLRALK